MSGVVVNAALSVVTTGAIAISAGGRHSRRFSLHDAPPTSLTAIHTKRKIPEERGPVFPSSARGRRGGLEAQRKPSHLYGTRRHRVSALTRLPSRGPITSTRRFSRRPP